MLVGLPVFRGLAIDCEQGVRHVLEIYRAELDGAMTLCGVTDVEQVDPALVLLPRSQRGRTVSSTVAVQLLAPAELMDRGRLSADEYRRAKGVVLAVERAGVGA